jgi:hypothetical protein
MAKADEDTYSNRYQQKTGRKEQECKNPQGARTPNDEFVPKGDENDVGIQVALCARVRTFAQT